MSFNDALSDMLARIKNAHKARKSFTSCYKSKLNLNVLTVLKDEGYIRDFKNIEVRKGISNIQIDLKYYNGDPVIKNIKRVSKPGCRVYSSINELPNIDVVNAGYNEGLLTVPGGQNIIRLLPPLNVSEEEIEIAVQMLDKCAKSLKKQKIKWNIF